MKYEDIDRILADDKQILPSPDFTRSVMESIWREVSTPAPIRFPWLRALPGFVAAAVTISLAVFSVLTTTGNSLVMHTDKAASATVSVVGTILATNPIGWAAFLLLVMAALIRSATRLSSV